jgi:hypothetical protein
MKGNDLDNRVQPRDVILFEHLLGILPDNDAMRRANKAIKKRRWREAVDCFDMNDMLVAKIWDLTMRLGWEVDVVTSLGHDFARELEARMTRENIPVSRVWYEESRQLGRRLASAPDIRNVYFADPGLSLVFGSRGKWIMPSQYNLLGSL